MFGQLAEEQKGKMGTSVKSGRQLLTRGEDGNWVPLWNIVFITIIIFCLSNSINTIIIIIIISSVIVRVTRGEDEDWEEGRGECCCQTLFSSSSSPFALSSSSFALTSSSPILISVTTTFHHKDWAGQKAFEKNTLKIAIYTTIHESFPASPSAVLIQHCHLVMKMLVKVTTDTICYNVNGGKMKERQGITCGRNLKIFVRLKKKQIWGQNSELIIFCP